MSDWATFFAAQVAAATLSGLLFVGGSLNLAKSLSSAALPDRALAGFYLLLANLVLSSLMLLPGQPLNLIGVVILAGVTWRALLAWRRHGVLVGHGFRRGLVFLVEINR